MLCSLSQWHFFLCNYNCSIDQRTPNTVTPTPRSSTRIPTYTHTHTHSDPYTHPHLHSHAHTHLHTRTDLPMAAATIIWSLRLLNSTSPTLSAPNCNVLGDMDALNITHCGALVLSCYTTLNGERQTTNVTILRTVHF